MSLPRTQRLGHIETATCRLRFIRRLFLRNCLTLPGVKKRMRPAKMRPLSAYLLIPGFT
jgi:hypothetical protein